MKLLSSLTLVSLLAAGCAGGFATVPADRWETVPTAQRETIDARNQADLEAACAEHTEAIAALAAARTALVVKVAAPVTPAAGPAATGSDADPSWAAEQRIQDQHKSTAMARVDAARDTAARAAVTWRERRLEAATAQLAVVEAKREFDRAYLIDRRMNQDETYDVGRFRGQLAHAQERWYAAEATIAEARAAMVRANGQLAAAKEGFARLIRTDEPSLFAVARTTMQLGGWTETSDMRRRGLKVEASLTEPCRRSDCFRRTSGETSYLMVNRRR